MLEVIHGEDGLGLDAHFSVNEAEGYFDVILESQGGSTGGRPPRNAHYVEGLKLLVQRHNFNLHEIQIASRLGRRRPEQERVIQLPEYNFPLNPAEIEDVEEFRLAIGRESASFGREDKTVGGSPRKRLLLRVVPKRDTWTSNEVIAALSGSSKWFQEPTSDPTELASRIDAALVSLADNHQKLPPPDGNVDVRSITSTTQRYIRDPNVVAWVLKEANGHCEVCDEPAPFLRDNNQPFLEAHHVVPLAEGGPDIISNAVGCCPNCHRELHHGTNRFELRNNLYKQIDRLRKIV